MRKVIQQFFTTLLQPINPAFTSVLGMLGVVWGCWVASPWWNVFESASAFQSTRLPEWFFGSLAILVGVAVIYGSLRPSFYSLAIGSGLASAFWFWVSLSLLIGDWSNTGWVTYFFVSVYGTLIYLNVRVNHANGHDWSGTDG